MPGFNLSVPHTLGKDEARARLESVLSNIEQKYSEQVKDVHQSWEGDKLNFGFKSVGVRIDGDMEVAEDQVAVSGKLPFSVMMFKGKIESAIRDELGKVLA